MIAPMLASSMSKADITNWNDWTMEEKYDGVRLVVEVDRSNVLAYTRERKHAGGEAQITRALPAHLVAELKRLPTGTYDGELLAPEVVDGRPGTSTDVPRTDLQSRLRFVVFDYLVVGADSIMSTPYSVRRESLARTFGTSMKGALHVALADARPCIDTETVSMYCHEVWDKGGEGLILKFNRGRYVPGKRSREFVKVKKLLTTVCTVVGFEATRGQVMNRGLYATVVLEDANGNRTSVKTRDDQALAEFNAHKGTPATHPALGRKLRIEYQDIAADGGYRHPRWDRWEEE